MTRAWFMSPLRAFLLFLGISRWGSSLDTEGANLILPWQWCFWPSDTSNGPILTAGLGLSLFYVQNCYLILLYQIAVWGEGDLSSAPHQPNTTMHTLAELVSLSEKWGSKPSFYHERQVDSVKPAALYPAHRRRLADPGFLTFAQYTKEWSPFRLTTAFYLLILIW